MMPKTIKELIIKLTNTREMYRREATKHDLKAAEAWVSLRATDDALGWAQALRDETKEGE